MKIVFETSYLKDTSLIISVREFKERFLFGIDFSRYGESMPDVVFENAILAAQQRIEEFLQLKLIKQIYREKKHFMQEDWQNWGYIPTQFPVACALEVSGFIGSIRQTLYPREWLSVKSTSDGQYLHRMMYLVPNVNATHPQIVAFTGTIPNLGYQGMRQIPNYWDVVYATGFDVGKVPATIMQVIGKIAAIDIFNIASDGMMAYPGVASTSISIDGLSQTLTSVANSKSGIFGARLEQYTQDLNGKDGKSGELKRLYDTYAAIMFGVA